MNPKSHYVAFGLFSLILLGAVFHQNLFSNHHFFATDITTQSLPDRVYFATHIRNGELPLWTQGIFCGYPLFAEGQSGVFYPFFVLFILIKDANLAYDLFILLHYWIGAICFYVYLRVRLFSFWPAAFAATSLMFSAYFFSFHIYANHLSALVWIPLYLAFFEKYLQADSKRWLAAGSLVLTLQFLAGHPQFAPMGILVGALLSTQLWKQYARYVLITGAIAFAVSAVQLIPHIEFLLHSQRAHGLPYKEITALSMYPEMFMQLLFPKYFGTLSQETFWAPRASPEENLLLYVGFALIVAVVGIVRYWKESLPEIALICIGALLAMGRYSPVSGVFHLWPLTFFRYPSRFCYLIVFGILVIAARELNLSFSGFSPRKQHLTGIIFVSLAVASELFFGLMPPTGFCSPKSQPKLELRPMERFVSLFDALVSDRIGNGSRPLCTKYNLFREIYGGDQPLLSPYWHSRGIYHSLIPSGYGSQFQTGDARIDEPRFLDLTNTSLLLSLQPHVSPSWKFEKKEGNVYTYRHQTQGAAFIQRPNGANLPCETVYVSDELLRFHCSNERPGYFFISMNHYPGWQFYVNGEKTDASTAYGFAIFLPVPSGENDIALHYNPLSFQIGIFLTFVGLFALTRMFLH